MKDIKILGTGCAKCTKLANNTEAAARQLGLEYQLEKVTELNDIMAHGVMLTPALVVDGEVLVTGQAPDVDAIKALLAG